MATAGRRPKKLLGKACPGRRAQFVQQLQLLPVQGQQDDGPRVVFADEAHLHLDTDLGWGWAPRGQRLYVNSTSPPLSKKLTCFGFYALGATEPVRVWTTHWANAETTNQMLGALRDSHPDRRLIHALRPARSMDSRNSTICVRRRGLQVKVNAGERVEGVSHTRTQPGR